MLHDPVRTCPATPDLMILNSILWNIEIKVIEKGILTVAELNASSSGIVLYVFCIKAIIGENRPRGPKIRVSEIQICTSALPLL